MEVHQLGRPPGKEYDYSDESELSDSDIERIEAAGVDEIWYWYSYGGYEGSGNCLMRSGDMWDVAYLGHCS